MCGVKDELHPYLEMIRDAEALVIASPRHHGDTTAWMYSFFSRFWCFLHDNHTLKNKPVIFVGVGCGEVTAGRETFRHSMIKEHESKYSGNFTLPHMSFLA